MEYCRASYGKPDNINWEIYDVSDNITPSMLEFYRKIGTTQAPDNIDKNNFLDEDGKGKDLRVYEIISEDGIVCFSQVFYKMGAVDNNGRKTMISKGILFDKTMHILSSPEKIMAINPISFDNCEISSSLIYDVEYTLESAMSILHIDYQQIVDMMNCVYMLLKDTMNDTLFIVCNEPYEKFRPLAYIIYSLLPFSMRYSLKMTTLNQYNHQGKNIVFTDKVSSSVTFYDIEEGKSSIEKNKLDEVKHNEVLLQRIVENPKSFSSEYCILLQQQLEKMGIPDTKDFDELKLADILSKGEKYYQSKDNMELLKFALEIISTAPVGNNYIDEYITNLLEEIYFRKIPVNESILKRISFRNEKTSYKELTKIAEKMEVDLLTSKSEAEVIQFLENLRLVKETKFNKYVAYIKETENGEIIITDYYINQINKCKTREDIHRQWDECHDYIQNKELKQCIHKSLFNIAKEKLIDSLKSGKSCARILEEYTVDVKQIYPKVSQEKMNEVRSTLMNSYWKAFNIKMFRFHACDIENYICMEKEDNRKYLSIIPLIELYNMVQKYYNYEPREFMFSLEKHIEKFQRNSFDVEEKIYINEMIQKYIVETLPYEFRCEHFVFWYKIADLNTNHMEYVNPFKNMLGWKLPVICDEDCFYDALESSRMESHIEEYIDKLHGSKYIDGCLKMLDSKSKEYSLLSSRAKCMEEYLKEKEKEKKRKDREESKFSFLSRKKRK